jgi:signal transduction histidine kinase
MDNAKEKLISFGQAIMPVAGVVLDFLGGLFENTRALLMIAGGIALVTVATGGWSVAQGILNFVMNMNPIIRIVSLILILGGIIWSLVGKYEGWGKSMKGLWEHIKGFVNLNAIAWKSFGENIWYWIQYAWLKVKGFVEWIGGAMKNVWNALGLAAQFKFGEAKAALTAEIKTTSQVQLQELEKRHAAGKLKNAQDSIAAIKQMSDGVNMIGLKKKAGSSTSNDPITANTDLKIFDQLKLKGGKGDGSIGAGKTQADSINSGGQRSIVINIGKQIEKLEVHVMNAKEGAAEIESAVRESLRRVLYSMNNVATG